MVVDFFTGRGKQDKDISVEKFIFMTSKNVRKRSTMDSFNSKRCLARSFTDTLGHPYSQNLHFNTTTTIMDMGLHFKPPDDSGGLNDYIPTSSLKMVAHWQQLGYRWCFCIRYLLFSARV